MSGTVITFPDTAFSSPAGEALTYSAPSGTVLSFNAATRTFTAYSIVHDRDVTITLTATDTENRSVSVNIEFYVQGTSTDIVSPPGPVTESVPLAMEGLQATQQTAQQSEQTEQTDTPNIQSYWFTYDADNRVAVDGGELDPTDSHIKVVERTGSVENTYDQAGNVVRQVTNGGPGYTTEIQTFTYDARGEQTSSTLINGEVEHKQYDADGRLVADVYTFAPGTTVSVTTGDGTFDLDIGGWVSTATTTYYNADGTVAASFEYGRQDTNWNSVLNRINDDTLSPVSRPLSE